VTFVASDGVLADTEVVAITVNDAGNQRPVLAPIGPQLVNEGANLSFIASATDPDGTIPAMTAVNLPTNATYVDNLNGTGTFNFSPNFTQAGVYGNVTFIAFDGTMADTEIVAITVNNVNRAPVLAAIGPRSVNEGAILNFSTSATDPDGTIPVMTAVNLPTNATYVDNLNGTGTFYFSPNFTQAGVYQPGSGINDCRCQLDNSYDSKLRRNYYIRWRSNGNGPRGMLEYKSNTNYSR
jgi:hypothetical protein